MTRVLSVHPDEATATRKALEKENRAVGAWAEDIGDRSPIQGKPWGVVAPSSQPNRDSRKGS